MKRGEILSTINGLSHSQGFYGRLLRDMRENPLWANEFLAELESQNFSDAVDLVCYLES